MAAAKTWNVDRQKGGSYEFSLDASGNYKLNSVGFNKVKTLNLPELKKEKTLPVHTMSDTKLASDQTTKAFGNVQPFYYKGGGADSNEQYINEYKIKKDKSLDTDQATSTRPEMLGDYGGSMVKDTRPDMLGDYGGSIKRDTTPAWAQDADKRGYENIGKVDKTPPNKTRIGRVNVDNVLAERARGEYSTTRPSGIDAPMIAGVKSPKNIHDKSVAYYKRQPGLEIANKRVTPQKTKVSETALRAVKSASSVLSKAVGFVFDHSILGTVVNAAVSPQQRQLNERNQEAFSSLGYKTRGELGSNRDPGRIAGNPAHDVFAGKNLVSMRGDVMSGARERISNRTKTAERNKNKWSPEKKERFDKKTQEFKGQVQKVQAKKNQQDIDKGPGALGPAGGGGNGGGGGGRVICTELHRAGEMSTIDWIRDTRFTFKTLTKSHVKGYLFWAVPTVEHMKKYPLYRKIWKHIAQHRANDIAWRLGEDKFDLLGRIYAGIGEPTCWLIGKFVSNKQYNELNLKNWRKA